MRRVAPLVLATLLGSIRGVAAQEPHPPTDVTYIANEGFLIEAAGKKVLVDSLFDAGSATLPCAVPGGARPTDRRRAHPSPTWISSWSPIPHGDHFNPKLVAAHLRNNPRVPSRRSHARRSISCGRRKASSRSRSGSTRSSSSPGSREARDRQRESASMSSACPTVRTSRMDATCTSRRGTWRSSSTWAALASFTLATPSIENSLAYLNAYPFSETPVDVSVLRAMPTALRRRSSSSHERIKPSRIIAMHVPPAELEEESKRIRAVYPHAIVFRQEHGAALASDRGRLPRAFGRLLRAATAWRDAARSSRVGSCRRTPTSIAHPPFLPTATKCSGGRTVRRDPTTKSGPS